MKIVETELEKDLKVLQFIGPKALLEEETCFYPQDIWNWKWTGTK